jgi:hypothetical protein
MPAAAPAPVTVTDDDMERAWHILHQPSWPATLAETLLDERRALLVCTYARQLARARARACTAPAPAPVRATPQRLWANRPRPTHAVVVDNKRAAAGDRDDD